MIEYGATLSDCGRYRYALWRRWKDWFTYGQVIFIGLNPSTADAETDDHTIRKMMGFARHWGFGGMVVCNLFAFRATLPPHMMNAEDPIGTENDEIISGYVRHRGTDKPSGYSIICCWGNHGTFKNRDRCVFDLFDTNPYCPEPRCLGLTKAGHPKHPARLAYNTPALPFKIRRK